MPDLTTAALLAIIAPHREMLKGMGWKCLQMPDNYGGYVTIATTDDSTIEAVPPSLAARILCDVCMEALEKWASNMVSVVSVWYDDLGHDHPWHASTTNRKHPVFSKPTRLAALLALCAWCREVKG